MLHKGATVPYSSIIGMEENFGPRLDVRCSILLYLFRSYCCFHVYVCCCFYNNFCVCSLFAMT